MSYAEYAHSIKNPQIIHMIIRKDNRWQYACMGCCSITKSKSTRYWDEVTCKNCLKHNCMWEND